MSRNLTASDRSALFRLASTLPKGSPERKAILKGLSKSASMNDWGFDDFLPPSELVKRGEEAAGKIEQNAKNLKQAMSRYSDDEPALEKWTLRIFGQMLMFGIKPALDGRFSDLADEAYRLGQKMQKQYK